MIYKDFFKARLKSSIIYTIIIIILSISWMGLFNSFSAAKPEILTFLNEINIEKLEALDINPNTIFEPLYFYSFFLTFGIIVYSLFAVNLAIQTILENNDKERLMLTKPIKRTDYLKVRIYISLAILVLSHILIFISLHITLAFFNVEHLFSLLFLIQLGIFLSQIAIYSLVLMITTFIPDAKLINILGVLLVLIFVMLEMVARVANQGWLTYINPLSYFNPNFTIEHKRLSFDYLAAMIALCFFSFSFTFNEYNSKEVA